jgi:hypothetical protein
MPVDMREGQVSTAMTSKDYSFVHHSGHMEAAGRAQAGEAMTAVLHLLRVVPSSQVCPRCRLHATAAPCRSRGLLALLSAMAGASCSIHNA